MAVKFQSTHVDQTTADKWVRWLQNCLPLPTSGWISGDGFKITNPEKMRGALLADLTGVGTVVRSRDALVADFSRFVRAWQVAAWSEELTDSDTIDELQATMEEIRTKKDAYAAPQLDVLRRLATDRILELRSKVGLEATVALSV